MKEEKKQPLFTFEQEKEFLKQIPTDEEKEIINKVKKEMEKQPLAGYENMPFWSLGPCIKCGKKGYPLSMGGSGICPACDCGLPSKQLTEEELNREYKIMWKLHLENRNSKLEKALLFAIRICQEGCVEGRKSLEGLRTSLEAKLRKELSLTVLAKLEELEDKMNKVDSLKENCPICDGIIPFECSCLECINFLKRNLELVKC